MKTPTLIGSFFALMNTSRTTPPIVSPPEAARWYPSRIHPTSAARAAATMSAAGSMERIVRASIATPCARAYSTAAIKAGVGGVCCTPAFGSPLPEAASGGLTSASTRGGGSSSGSLAVSAIAMSGATPSGFATATSTPPLRVVVIVQSPQSRLTAPRVAVKWRSRRRRRAEPPLLDAARPHELRVAVVGGQNIGWHRLFVGDHDDHQRMLCQVGDGFGDIVHYIFNTIGCSRERATGHTRAGSGE